MGLYLFVVCGERVGGDNVINLMFCTVLSYFLLFVARSQSQQPSSSPSRSTCLLSSILAFPSPCSPSIPDQVLWGHRDGVAVCVAGRCLFLLFVCLVVATYNNQEHLPHHSTALEKQYLSLFASAFISPTPLPSPSATQHNRQDLRRTNFRETPEPSWSLLCSRSIPVSGRA